MVEAVVWDIGNVIGIWDPESYYDERFGRERREQFFAETGIHDVNLRLDQGAPARQTLAEHAARHQDYAEEIRLWFDDWGAMFTEPVPGTAELFREVKSTGVKMLALSNFWVETLPIAKQLHPVLKEFDEEYVSGHLGLMKPEAGIYIALEEGSGLTGEALIFTDDKAENIAAAEARGWKGHLFDGADGWRARLVAEGVLSA